MNCTYCKRETFRSRLPPRVGAELGLLRTRDHVVPLSRGGKDVRENRVVACAKCNGLKGNMMPDEWARFMRENPIWWAMTKRDRVDRERRRTAKWGPRQAVKAPPSALNSMTAAENARRIKAYLAANADGAAPAQS